MKCPNCKHEMKEVGFILGSKAQHVGTVTAVGTGIPLKIRTLEL